MEWTELAFIAGVADQPGAELLPGLRVVRLTDELGERTRDALLPESEGAYDAGHRGADDSPAEYHCAQHSEQA